MRATIRGGAGRKHSRWNTKLTKEEKDTKGRYAPS